MSVGYELKVSGEKGEGIFATQPFKAGDLVMEGRIEKVLEENHSHASQIGLHTYVFHAGYISKVNHCCDPNCGVKVNETGAHDFVARKDIEVGEEITFDYAMRNYGIDHFPEQCMCGSPICRGQVTGWKDLPEDRKQAYEGFVAPYLLELDAQAELAAVAN